MDIPLVFWLVHGGVCILMGEIHIVCIQQVHLFHSVQYVILSITLMSVPATPGIVTGKIGSRADVSAGCPEVELSGPPKGGGAQNSVSAMDITPVLHT